MRGKKPFFLCLFPLNWLPHYTRIMVVVCLLFCGFIFLHIANQVFRSFDPILEATSNGAFYFVVVETHYLHLR